MTGLEGTERFNFDLEGPKGPSRWTVGFADETAMLVKVVPHKKGFFESGITVYFQGFGDDDGKTRIEFARDKDENNFKSLTQDWSDQLIVELKAVLQSTYDAFHNDREFTEAQAQEIITDVMTRAGATTR